MGAGTSVGSPAASVITERGKTKIELDQTSARSMADKHQMKTEEVMLLWKRFQELGPNKDGHVHRSVFADNPVYTSDFCRQVWGRMGQEGNAEIITFDKFLTNMKHFHYDSSDEKLKRYFSWMAEDDQMTKDQLKLFVSHTLPDASDEEVMGKVDVVMKVMDPLQKGYITSEDFMTFMHSIPEEQLSRALSFSILPNGGHQSEHHTNSTDDTQPV